MKPFLPIALLALMLFSCNHSPVSKKENGQKAETPKALQPETVDVSFTKTRGEDMVESLYQELVDKNPALKALEDEIKHVQENKNDSTSAFDGYNNKNSAYYFSATNHLPDIKDSLLRHRIELLINKSQADYNGGISKYTALQNTINAKNETLSDLHTVLKIIKTLPVVEAFQKNHAPGTKPMEGIVKEYDKAIKIVDPLTKVQ